MAIRDACWCMNDTVINPMIETLVFKADEHTVVVPKDVLYFDVEDEGYTVWHMVEYLKYKDSELESILA